VYEVVDGQSLAAAGIDVAELVLQVQEHRPSPCRRDHPYHDLSATGHA